MTESNSKLTLSAKGKLELKNKDTKVRQNFSNGRSKVVKVEVRKKRSVNTGGKKEEPKLNDEMAHKLKLLKEAQKKAEEEAKIKAEQEAKKKAEEEKLKKQKAKEKSSEKPKEKGKKENKFKDNKKAEPVVAAPAEPLIEKEKKKVKTKKVEPVAKEDDSARKKAKKKAAAPDRRRSSKLTISDALDMDGEWEEARGRSLAAIKRARKKEKQKHQEALQTAEKIIREVVIPEAITVQELASRMSEKGVAVIKILMKMGVMATINQMLDADTAQLVVEEMGHKFKRVSDADVEESLFDIDDKEADLRSRPPVVTVMGHVDHGKTSLLDALRDTQVADKEAGGITQHIGAYQIVAPTGEKITFIDTPGHAAFTAMRARGAQVTDIVILVVAADDGIMPQTIEAIRHAKAAGVPIVVAVNKIDKPGADPSRIRTDLLSHELVVEEMGGDVMAIDVSAKQRMNLDKLLEGVLLQAEMLDLKANPSRIADGVVVEAKMEKGRGSVATVLVKNGTIKTGDILVAGKEWGHVRALVSDSGKKIKSGTPAQPVEILGLQGTPAAGDTFNVVETEGKAREVAEYRARKEKAAMQIKSTISTTEQFFARIKAGEVKDLPIIIKADVQGSVEALIGTLEKMANDEVKVNVLHAAVGGINESDITLARASDAIVIGFNVRANPQARALAKRDAVDIKYYSIIYDVADDIKKLLEGMLTPEIKESIIGYAEIRKVFNVSKVGKIAGCMITEGMVKRGAKIRLLRDNVVIHDGTLGQLKRFKDDAKEVKEGYECGMSFENYNDIQTGDFIECYVEEEIAGKL
jgi:translation initiation factor IF-2